MLQDLASSSYHSVICGMQIGYQAVIMAAWPAQIQQVTQPHCGEGIVLTSAIAS